MQTMDIHHILKLLPHRYPFLLVDRVLEIEKGQSIVALKNVTINEPFFNGDRKSTRLNSSHIPLSRMPSSA